MGGVSQLLAKGACSNRAHPLQERARAWISWCLEDLLWASLFHNSSTLEIADAIGDVGGKGHLMRCDEHRHTALGECA